MANAPVTTPAETRDTYWTMAKMSPPVRPVDVSIRQPPKYTISTAAMFSRKVASGEMAPMATLPRMKLLAMIRVASDTRSCSRFSELNARMTRMPRRRSRMISFCRSTNLSDTSQMPSIFFPMKITIARITGTKASMVSDSAASFRRDSTTPPKNSTGIMMTVPDSSAAIQLTVSTSWEQRVTSAAVPSSPNSSKLIWLTLRNTAARRSAQKDATTSLEIFDPKSTVPNPTRATAAMMAQHLTM